MNGKPYLRIVCTASYSFGVHALYQTFWMWKSTLRLPAHLVYMHT